MLYFSDLKCVFCNLQNSVDSFEHYLENCGYIKTQAKFKTMKKNIQYSDLFGTLENQSRIVKFWCLVDKERSEILTTRSEV